MTYFAVFYAVVATLLMVCCYVVVLPITLVIYNNPRMKWRVKVHFKLEDMWIGVFMSKNQVLWVCPLPCLAIRIWQEEEMLRPVVEDVAR
jgi:hypothetical protein